MGRVSAQELDGVWIQVYEKYPEEIIEAIPVKSEMRIASTIGPDSITLENIEYEFESNLTGDSLYKYEFALIELRESTNSQKSYWNDPGKVLYYTMENGKYISTFDDRKLILNPFNDSLEILEYRGDTLRNLSVWKKLPEQAGTSPDQMIPRFEKNTWWEINSDPTSPYDQTTVHILDSSSSVIIYRYENLRMSSLSEYFTPHFNKHIFLLTRNRFGPGEFIFHLIRSGENEIEVQYYQEGFVTDKPLRKTATLQKKTLPSNEDITHIKNRIIGTWEINNIPIPYEQIRYDSLISSRMIFTFKSDSSFAIEKSGVLRSTEGNNLQKNETLEGQWRMGRTGEYLRLEFEDEMRLATITSISPELLELHMTIRSFNARNVRYITDTPLNLKRIDTR